jgi:hypothetical protein
MNSKLIILVFLSALFAACDYEITDFGFEGAISGTVKDASGTPVFADLTTNTLVVKLLGEGDKLPAEIRVNGEGNYQNLKMYPKKHKVWLEGPIVKSDTISVDFTNGEKSVQDFTVTPLLVSKITSGIATGTSIKVDYIITPAAGITVKKMEIYCSTVPYPTTSTGSLTNVYFTSKTNLTALSGSVTITGLAAGTKYNIRIGAQGGTSVLYNFSNQITVSTP